MHADRENWVWKLCKPCIRDKACANPGAPAVQLPVGSSDYGHHKGKDNDDGGMLCPQLHPNPFSIFGLTHLDHQEGEFLQITVSKIVHLDQNSPVTSW